MQGCGPRLDPESEGVECAWVCGGLGEGRAEEGTAWAKGTLDRTWLVEEGASLGLSFFQNDLSVLEF